MKRNVVKGINNQRGGGVNLTAGAYKRSVQGGRNLGFLRIPAYDSDDYVKHEKKGNRKKHGLQKGESGDRFSRGQQCHAKKIGQV